VLKILFFLVSSLVFGSAAFGNRILDPKYNDPGRCAAEPMPPQECADEQQYVFDQGWVSAEELATLRERGLYSMHTRNGTLKGVCPCGCFEASTKILTLDNEGREAYKKVKNVQRGDSIASLEDQSTLDNLVWFGRDIHYATKGPETEALYVFQVSNGSRVALTQNHAVLLASGKVVTAKDVSVGDQLVSYKGGPAFVQKISRRYTKDNVYNFAIKGQSKLNHFVVAEDLVVGDILWQNTLGSEINSIAIRQK
jgi:hypothetical protein